VPGAQVQMVVRRSAMSWGGWDNYEFNDGNLYSRDTYRGDQVVAQDVRTTGADGTVTIDIPTVADAPDSNYNFDFTITDGSGRQIQHSNSVTVYAASIRVSAHATVGYVPLGRLLPIAVQLVDLDGKPVSGKVDVELRHQV